MNNSKNLTVLALLPLLVIAGIVEVSRFVAALLPSRTRQLEFVRLATDNWMLAFSVSVLVWALAQKGIAIVADARPGFTLEDVFAAVVLYGGVAAFAGVYHLAKKLDFARAFLGTQAPSDARLHREEQQEVAIFSMRIAGLSVLLLVLAFFS